MAREGRTVLPRRGSVKAEARIDGAAGAALLLSTTATAVATTAAILLLGVSNAFGTCGGRVPALVVGPEVAGRRRAAGK